ncbi:predicted protein [Postia placenta Mad-698-R]|nr:predicted protein [Postia placenta Mad-698-R]
MAACQGLIHTFDSKDLIDVYITDSPSAFIIAWPNIRSALVALSRHDPHPNIPALSPPTPAYPDRLPVQVKHEETLISLQTLRQSQSLRRVKESQSPSPLFSVGPHHQLCSPPRQQSLIASIAVATERPLAHSFPPKSARWTATTTASAPRLFSVPPATNNVYPSPSR